MDFAQRLVPIIDPIYSLIWIFVAAISALLLAASISNDVVRGRADVHSFLVFAGYLIVAAQRLGVLGASGLVTALAVGIECALIFELPVYFSQCPKLIKDALHDSRLGEREAFTLFLYVMTFVYRVAIVAVFMADYFYVA